MLAAKAQTITCFSNQHKATVRSGIGFNQGENGLYEEGKIMKGTDVKGYP